MVTASVSESSAPMAFHRAAPGAAEGDAGLESLVDDLKVYSLGVSLSRGGGGRGGEVRFRVYRV